MPIFITVDSFAQLFTKGPGYDRFAYKRNNITVGKRVITVNGVRRSKLFHTGKEYREITGQGVKLIL